VWKPKPKWFFPVVGAVIATIIVAVTALTLKAHGDKETAKNIAEEKERVQKLAAQEEEKNWEKLFSICSISDGKEKSKIKSSIKDDDKKIVTSIIENLESGIDANQVVLTGKQQKELFPKLFEEGSSGKLYQTGLKDLINCKREIGKFIGQNENQSTCNPLIKDTEIDELEQKIKTYQDKNKDFYEGVIEENSKAKYCGEKINKIEFLTKCYDSWAEKKLKLPKKSENERFEFWKKAGHLLESCRKVGS
jgi:hypothetical protein